MPKTPAKPAIYINPNSRRNFKSPKTMLPLSSLRYMVSTPKPPNIFNKLLEKSNQPKAKKALQSIPLIVSSIKSSGKLSRANKLKK